MGEVNMSFNAVLMRCRCLEKRLLPRLNFHIDIKNDSNQKYNIQFLTGEVTLYKNDSAVGFATLNPLISGYWFNPRSTITVVMNLDLTHRQIEVIEELRKENDVFFGLNLRFLFERTRAPSQTRGSENVSLDITVRRAGNGNKLMISQSEWVKMLNEMGYERLRVIELPIPELPHGTIINTSVEFVEEALKKFNEGYYSDVLTDCRKAIENLKKVDIDLVTTLGSKSKANKITDIQNKLHQFLHLGPHEESKDYIDRRDAELALHITTSIIRYFVKQL